MDRSTPIGVPVQPGDSVTKLVTELMDRAIATTGADRGFLFLQQFGRLVCRVGRTRDGLNAVPECPWTLENLASVLRPDGLWFESANGLEACPFNGRACAKGHASSLLVPVEVAGEVVAIGLLDRSPGPGDRFGLHQLELVRSVFAEMVRTSTASTTAPTRATTDTRRRAAVGCLEFSEILGNDPALLATMHDAWEIARTDVGILILGETGTGKELLASAIHSASRRATRPYIAFNCTDTSPELISSEFFGHRRGSFTGAATDRIGLFESAEGGTVLLDEVGDLNSEVQPRLLRLLQSGEIRRIGDAKPRFVDIRVLAATNQDFTGLTGPHRLRADLQHRLGVATLRLPALRDRVDDIPLLANHFLNIDRKAHDRAMIGFSDEAMATLMAQPWPGNIRQLENTVERAVLLARTDQVAVADLRLNNFGAASDGVAAKLSDRHPTLVEVERHYFEQLLHENRGNRSEVARVAGIPRSTMVALLKRLGLH